MIKLERQFDEKWIFQKNVSSAILIKEYIKVLEQVKEFDKKIIKDELKQKHIYKGRSSEGSESTMGVRFSQMCFYMFGYKNSKHTFIPSQTTSNILENTNDVGKNMLVNLFSLQYPHPYSKTNSDFNIYAGRLIVKLLTDDRIKSKIYIDEFIWFLPFFKSLDNEKYENLIQSILDYRKLNYCKKLSLFNSVDDSDHLFSNCLHEINYYFIKIFRDFDVFQVIPERNHNQGKLFSFKHGNTKTYRSDRISKQYNCSGYIKLEDNLICSAKKLIAKYPATDKPITLSDPWVFSKKDWITDLYEVNLLNYLGIVFSRYKEQKEIINAISHMQYMSKYSSIDGKDFENSLKPVFELFRESANVEIISGSGDTDLLCAFENITNSYEDIYKFNVDAKSRKSSLNMNVMRLKRHIVKHGSTYCIVVAPRFSKGTILDISGMKIVTITADTLARYCQKEALSNKDQYADYSSLDNIIRNNYGRDITPFVDNFIDSKYGIEIL